MPELSDVESILEDRVERFLADRIEHNLVSANAVTFDPDSNSPVPALVRAFFDDPDTLLNLSREMATHLFSCQSAVSPSGLLIAAEISIDRRLALAVLKVEEENGLQVETREELTDQRGYRMILHDDLLLTQKVRVYKVSKFERIDGSIEGRVLDSQQGPGTLVAGFFLNNFLGCRLGERADVTTQAFFNAAETFINTHVRDSGQRSRYEIALLGLMQSHENVINVPHFASAHLDVEHRQAFELAIKAANVPLSVPKDVALVQHRIESVEWAFDGGVSVVAPPEQAGAITTEMDGDETKLTIQGLLTKTSGRGKR